MTSVDPEALQSIRETIRSLCLGFGDEYWAGLDRANEYPSAFVDALTEGGWLSVLIPEQYGGGGQGIAVASAILEEINSSGGQAAAAHAQMYTMGALVGHGSEELKTRVLPDIASGRLRLQAFAVTEPDAGSDTTQLRTFAQKEGEAFRLTGQKIFISRALHSDLMLVLARTTPRDECDDKTKGLSLFLVDIESGLSSGALDIRPIEVMQNHHTTEVHFDGLLVSEDNLVGREGEGFRHIIDGWNAERILVASEAVGDARWFVAKAVQYTSERRVFGRPIGSNQGIQFPLAQAFADLEAAALMRDKAASLFDESQRCGKEANLAKLLASKASWNAANVCMDAFGGYGFAKEYHIERKFRETRLLLTAPVSNNLVLGYIAHHVLGMPRSY